MVAIVKKTKKTRKTYRLLKMSNRSMRKGYAPLEARGVRW
jgi:hypothetical protein